MPALRHSLGLLLLLLVAGGCASSTGGPETGEPRRSRDPNRITREEILNTHTSDAFEAVRVLRPNWLQKRGNMSVTQSTEIQVYLDNTRMGGPDILRSIATTTVGSMQFLDAASATQRWGTGHVHGVILVNTMTRSEEIAWGARAAQIAGGAAEGAGG